MLGLVAPNHHAEERRLTVAATARDSDPECRPGDAALGVAQLGHATASITLDTYGHLFPSEMEALANRLELVRDAALAKRGRTQHGPTDNRLGETAGG
jgi:hypothetical protein